ncbi:MAG: glycosyltransferase N-terminal domain-containing protein, partial [Myxococcota bacterium]
MAGALMTLVRALLSYVVFVLALPILIAHPKLRRGYRQRLGWYRKREIPTAPGPRVWMHGASAGDVLALIPTVRALKSMRPDTQVMISTTTNTGRAMAMKFKDEIASVVYQPYDIPGAVNRALARLKPDVLVLEYTELWPQLIHRSGRRGVSVVLHNGRFSGQRLYRYRWLFRIAGNVLAGLSALLMRDEIGAESARALGAPDERVRVTGNTKFDNLPQPPSPDALVALREALGLQADALVWVAGSTHEGEEELLFPIFLRVRE